MKCNDWLVWCGAGWGPTQATIRRGVRWSTYRAYLRRIMNNDNVHVLTHGTALKVRLLACRQANYWLIWTSKSVPI